MSDNICLSFIISDRIRLVVVLPTPVFLWCNFCTTAKLSKFGRDLRCGSIVAGGDLDTHNDVADDKEVLVGVGGGDVLETNFFRLLVQIFLFLLWKSIWKVLIIQTKMDKVIEVIISDTFSTTYESIRLNFVELLAKNQHASTVVYAQYIQTIVKLEPWKTKQLMSCLEPF